MRNGGNFGLRRNQRLSLERCPRAESIEYPTTKTAPPGPMVEVVGRSKEKAEELFWDPVTQVRTELTGSRGNSFRYFVRQFE